jgi:tetratricopeptide (TPR) repeat protein
MLSKTKFQVLLVTGAAVVAMVLIFVSVYDWGGDDRTGSDVAFQTRKPTRTATTIQRTSTPTPPATETKSLAEEPEEVFITEPEPPKEVTYEEAETAFFEKRYDEAVQLFTRYTERKSENPWGYYMLGLSAWKAGNNEDAEGAFEQALALDQHHVKSWINLSRVLLDSSRPSEALARLDEALALDPQSNAAYRLQGRAYHQLGRIDEAIEAYRRAIQINDQDAWSMNNIALIFIEEQRYEKALPPLARAIELANDVAVFHNNLGMALECTGYIRAAEQAYREAVAVDKSYEKALANLERTEVVLEDPDVESVDLLALAQSFVDEIGSWSVAAGDSEMHVSVEPGSDAIVVSPESDAIVASDVGTADADSTDDDSE